MDERERQPETGIELRRVMVSQDELEELRADRAELERLRRATAMHARHGSAGAGFDVERFLGELLRVLDNYARAMEAARIGRGFDAIIEGLERVTEQTETALLSVGVRRWDSVGEPVDEGLHEVADGEPAPGMEGRVVRELRPGYLFGERVLRRAFVVVGTGDDEHAGGSGAVGRDE